MQRSRVVVTNANRKRRIRKKPIEQLVLSVLRREAAPTAELHIVFVGDQEMVRLNRQFLRHNGTTDVISFRLDEENVLEGEVYVNTDQAKRQAKTYKAREVDEIRRLVIHGTLHLVGYDDTTRIKRSIMRSLEDKYLRWKNH